MNKSKKKAFQKFYKTDRSITSPNLEKKCKYMKKKVAVVKVPLKLNTNRFIRKHQCGNLVK